MINGAFTIIVFDGKYLFIKRKDKGLWDLAGGGFNASEVDYKGVVSREIFEETRITIQRDQLHLFAILGQRLPQHLQAIHKVEKGFVFLHYAILHSEPEIVLSEEHTDHYFFSYTEILERYKEFSSGPLWEFFTYLTFQETQKLQEGMLRDRATWQGKSYV